MNGFRWLIVFGMLLAVAQGSAHADPASCRKVTVAADVTVDTTSGGTQVVGVNAQRCEVCLQNAGSETARCRGAGDGNPTTSHGARILPDGAVCFGPATSALKCIVGANSTTIIATERVQ